MIVFYLRIRIKIRNIENERKQAVVAHHFNGSVDSTRKIDLFLIAR